MISLKQNKIYLFGEVNHQGKIVNNFEQINITVEAMTDNCEGKLILNSEIIKVHF